MVPEHQNRTQLSISVEPTECEHYENCAAPLCPKAANLEEHIWFPNEPICRLRGAPDWVRKQRKIAKLTNIDSSKFFTLRMLNAITRINHGLQGADPDYAGDQQAWLAQGSGKASRVKHSFPNSCLWPDDTLV